VKKAALLFTVQVMKDDSLILITREHHGRYRKDLVALINELRERGVEFVSLTKAIDTTTPMGSLIFHITAALAELERSIIRERTRAYPHACGRSRTNGRRDRLAVSREPRDDHRCPA